MPKYHQSIQVHPLLEDPEQQQQQQQQPLEDFKLMTGSLFKGRWTSHAGQFKTSISMTSITPTPSMTSTCSEISMACSSAETSTTSTASSSASNGSTSSNHSTISNTKSTMSTTPSTIPSGTSSSDCWPWMKEAKSRIHHPINHIDHYDRRRGVEVLIDKHHNEINDLREELKDDPLYNPRKHDDLWIMRFLFSHNWNQATALEAAKSTLQFRHEHRLDEQDIRHMEITQALIGNPNPYAHAAGKMVACYEPNTMIYYIPEDKRGLIGFLQLAGRNQHLMVEQLTEQDYFDAHIFHTEWKFQWLDYLTRTTGLLTKYLSIADCAGAKRAMINNESKRRDGAAAKFMEDKYPQLLGSMMVVNAPIWINIIFTIIKPVLPKRLLEKVNLIKPLKKEHDRKALMEYIRMEHLPERYGGELPEWPPQATLPTCC